MHCQIYNVFVNVKFAFSNYSRFVGALNGRFTIGGGKVIIFIK